MTDFKVQVHLCVALRRPPQLPCSTGGTAYPAAQNKMASQSCQRGPENAHTHPKGPCCSALCFLCSLGSSLNGRSLGAPRKCGGRNKPVQSSPEGSRVAEWPDGLLSLLLLLWCLLPSAGRMQVEGGRGRCSSCHPWWALMGSHLLWLWLLHPACIMSAFVHRAED